MLVKTEDLDFDPFSLQRGRKHSGEKRRVVVRCGRCDICYEIGEGGNIVCPSCNELDTAHVLWREIEPDLWKKAGRECAVPGCSNEPTHEVEWVGRIPGTPKVPTYVCEEHRDVVQVRRLEDE